MHCSFSFAGSAYFLPCGSALGNMFLILSKLGALLVAATELEYVFRADEMALTASDVITTIFTFVSSAQTACQLLVASVLLLRTAMARSRLTQVPDAAQLSTGLLSVPCPIPLVPSTSEDEINLNDEEMLGECEDRAAEVLDGEFSPSHISCADSEDDIRKSGIPDIILEPENSLPSASIAERHELLDDILRGLSDANAWRRLPMTEQHGRKSTRQQQ